MCLCVCVCPSPGCRFRVGFCVLSISRCMCPSAGGRRAVPFVSVSLCVCPVAAFRSPLCRCPAYAPLCLMSDVRCELAFDLRSGLLCVRVASSGVCVGCGLRLDVDSERRLGAAICELRCALRVARSAMWTSSCDLRCGLAIRSWSCDLRWEICDVDFRSGRGLASCDLRLGLASCDLRCGLAS